MIIILISHFTKRDEISYKLRVGDGQVDNQDVLLDTFPRL